MGWDSMCDLPGPMVSMLLGVSPFFPYPVFPFIIKRLGHFTLWPGKDKGFPRYRSIVAYKYIFLIYIIEEIIFLPYLLQLRVYNLNKSKILFYVQRI